MNLNPLDIQQQLADQRRGRYVRVSDVDRRQLIDTYKKGEDFIALAKKLNIKRSTARSILRTYIDEGRISAKQRAGTRLRFITEEEAEMIREMKRRHPLITIGQIQMRLQRTSNRVLSKASISRILTNSIRLGKRAKRSVDGEDEREAVTGMINNISGGPDDLMQLSSDEGTGGSGGAIFIDDTNDEEPDDEDDEEGGGGGGMTERNNHHHHLQHQSSLQNLDDFQRFMLRKASVNGDESTANDGASWDTKDQYDENAGHGYDNGYTSIYQNYGSEEDEDELSELEEGEEVHENEATTPIDLRSEITPTPSIVNGTTPTVTENGCWNLSVTPVKSEPVCVFLNRNYDTNSSDSEHLQEQQQQQQQQPMEDESNKTPNILPTPPSAHSTANRRVKSCPICGQKNFSRLSHHLTVAHNLDRHESLTLLAYTDRNNNTNNHNSSSIATVSGSSPPSTTTAASTGDKSPQQTPISINTNNQQVTCASSPISESGLTNNTVLPQPSSMTTTSSSPIDQQTSAYMPVDGKKRLLCPRCDTWVLNLTDHLIKKHHLVSKQERLPFLRLARNRYATPTSTPSATVNGVDKTSTNSFLISPDHSLPSQDSNEQHQQQQQQLHQSNLIQQAASRKYQNIVKKYRKKFLGSMPPPSSNHSATSSLPMPLPTSATLSTGSSSNSNSTVLNDKTTSLPSPYEHSIVHSGLSLGNHESQTAASHNILTMNSIQSLLTNGSNSGCKQEKFKFGTLNEHFPSRTFSAIKTSGHSNMKDQHQLATHQKFEQRLTVFRQQFAVTLAMQNSLMQQMELLQRSFVCIEDEWNDMKKQVVSSVS